MAAAELKKPFVVVLTGAGISAESGIRTFRAADGLWEEHRVEDVATPEGFQRDPALVQAFTTNAAASCRRKRSPRTPRTVRWRTGRVAGDNFLLVTQNIDNLHERAGSKRVLHMHGELLKVRCTQSGRVRMARRSQR